MPDPSRFSRFWDRLRPAPIATAEALQAFLQERAFFIAQKCAIDYCRGKTGLASYALFTEKPFLEALDVCRWETFVAALGDLLIMTEQLLRPQVPAAQRRQLCAALVGLHCAMLGALPAPAHRSGGWGDDTETFSRRLEAASEAPPRATLEIADYSARRLFDTLPIHSNMRALDEEVVFGAVRFRMIALSQEMQRRLRTAELAPRLLAGQNVAL
ncbi:MAG: hypothetical protein ACREUH_08100 [Burkholderiales bacterium]